MSADIRKIVEKGTIVTAGKKTPVCRYFISIATAKLNNINPKWYKIQNLTFFQFLFMTFKFKVNNRIQINSGSKEVD